MDDEQTPKGHEKYDPTGEFVKEPYGLVRIPVLDAQPRAKDAHRIRRNRDWNAR